MSDYAPDEATARADVSRFLAACYYEPDAAFAEEQLFDSLRLATLQIYPDLADSAAALGDAFAATDLQTLLVDYTHLFLGPLQTLAQPYESQWLPEPSAEDQAPLPILAVYDEGGFELDETFLERPDHIAVELEFLYLLQFRQHAATNSESGDDSTQLLHLQQRFLCEHLGIWIKPFAAAVQDGAETLFYRQLAAFTAAYIAREVTRVRSA